MEISRSEVLKAKLLRFTGVQNGKPFVSNHDVSVLLQNVRLSFRSLLKKGLPTC
jgi:hypothetical protein